jgi:hypothetical protein
MGVVVSLFGRRFSFRRLRIASVRCTIPLLLTMVVPTLVACGKQDAASPPPTLAQRFITARDAPGSNPDPIETRQTTKGFDKFVAALKENAISPNRQEIAKAFRRVDFKSAGIDLRFYGKRHQAGRSTHVGSSFVELKTKEGATRALDWLEADESKPCPKSCATQISTFDVQHLSDGRGVRRIATAERIARLGFADERPMEHYWVGFTVGDLAYTVDLFGLPGALSEKQVLEIAHAYYDRLTHS